MTKKIMVKFTDESSLREAENEINSFFYSNMENIELIKIEELRSSTGWVFMIVYYINLDVQ